MTLIPMPSANTRHRASLRPVLFPAGFWFVWYCVAVCCCFLLGASRKQPQYDPESAQNRPRIKKKGLENHVLRVSGVPWGIPWGHFGTGGAKVNAGTRNCFKNHVFCGCEFRKLALCAGVVRKRPAKVSYFHPDRDPKR